MAFFNTAAPAPPCDVQGCTNPGPRGSAFGPRVMCRDAAVLGHPWPARAALAHPCARPLAASSATALMHTDVRMPREGRSPSRPALLYLLHPCSRACRPLSTSCLTWHYCIHAGHGITTSLSAAGFVRLALKSPPAKRGLYRRACRHGHGRVCRRDIFLA